MNIKQFSILFKARCTKVKNQRTRALSKGKKKRLNIALAALDAVRNRFPETQEFIDSTLKEECEKERMTPDKVIFYKFKSKKLVWINIFVLDLDLVLKYLFFCL